MEKWNWKLMIITLVCLMQACVSQDEESITLSSVDSLQAKSSLMDSVKNTALGDSSAFTLPGHVNTRGVPPQKVVDYAKTLLGVPYRYGVASPAKGFDCSGFVMHVFAHHDIVVPRSSIAFTHVGKEVPAAQAKPGDIILFTGTNPKERFVGHMGIVVNNQDTLQFIHATSGKAHGVTISPLNASYQRRYVKTIRIFPENG